MSQTQKLYNLLSDGKPHRTDQIMEVVYGNNHLGLCRIGSRINDLIKQGVIFINKDGKELTEYGKHKGWKDEQTPSLFWYRIKQKDTLFNIPENKVVSDQDMLKFR